MSLPAPCLLIAVAALFIACGDDAEVPLVPAEGFVVVGHTPPDHGTLYLDDGIAIDMSHPVDPASAEIGAITIEVLDRDGNALHEEVTGRFQLARSPGDAEPGRRVVFSPTLPTSRALDNGGFRPRRIYRVRLSGGEGAQGAVLRDVSGRRLSAPLTFTVATPVGETVNELFRAASGDR